MSPYEVTNQPTMPLNGSSLYSKSSRKKDNESGNQTSESSLTEFEKLVRIPYHVRFYNNNDSPKKSSPVGSLGSLVKDGSENSPSNSKMVIEKSRAANLVPSPAIPSVPLNSIRPLKDQRPLSSTESPRKTLKVENPSKKKNNFMEMKEDHLMRENRKMREGREMRENQRSSKKLDNNSPDQHYEFDYKHPNHHRYSSSHSEPVRGKYNEPSASQYSVAELKQKIRNCRLIYKENLLKDYMLLQECEAARRRTVYSEPLFSSRSCNSADEIRRLESRIEMLEMDRGSSDRRRRSSIGSAAETMTIVPAHHNHGPVVKPVWNRERAPSLARPLSQKSISGMTERMTNIINKQPAFVSAANKAINDGKCQSNSLPTNHQILLNTVKQNHPDLLDLIKKVLTTTQEDLLTYDICVAMAERCKKLNNSMVRIQGQLKLANRDRRYRLEAESCDSMKKLVECKEKLSHITNHFFSDGIPPDPINFPLGSQLSQIKKLTEIFQY